MADIRYALRLLRRAPLFTAAIVLTIAVGIGGTTTIFSVVNAVLIRPLPFDRPDGLMQVAERNDALHLPAFAASALNYLSWKEDYTVVGVVGDVRSTTLNRESPSLYFPVAERSWTLMDIVIRSAGGQAALMRAARQTVQQIDPDLPLTNVRPMGEWVSTSAAQPRLSAELLALFACLALLIAAIGTYGVLAYSVSQRTKELGLRMALGADPQDVLALIVREGMTVGLAGIGVGLAAAAAIGRVLTSLTYGVSVRDPATYVAVTLLLIAIALLACGIPAVRASRVDPMTALRLD